MQEAIAIALIGTAVGLRRLRMFAAGRIGAMHRIGRQKHRFPLKDDVPAGFHDPRKINCLRFSFLLDLL